MLVRRGDSPILVSRLSAFEGDHEAWRLYTPPWLSLRCSSRRRSARPSSEETAIGEGTAVLPEANAASPWGAGDFDLAQELLDRIGVLANSDATGLTAELPWDEGAVSHVQGFLGGPQGRTSLLRLTTTERHPALGSGLLCRLTLPLSYGQDQIARAACRLNLLELAAIDAPPFLGAWTVDPETRRPTYVTFWPNVLYRRGVVANLATWMMARRERAKRWAEVDMALGALAREGGQ
jgi:hypothetical protein